MTTLLELPTDYSEPLWGERRELVCAECGYGALVREEPPECPMCRGGAWLEQDLALHAVA